MRRQHFFLSLTTIVAAIAALSFFGVRQQQLTPGAYAKGLEPTPGSLVSLDPEGQPGGLCPLKHTDVKADISGPLARVTVKQQFENPFEDKIEAVYTFPLPQNAAVDDLTMLVGDRTIRGQIKKREDARAIYDAARAAGHVAALLDQERPNIFTQSVANIMPGEKVTVTISYVETLKYDEGSYAFVFPTVVGPRYIPGAPTGQQSTGWSPDTDQVPDASRITPPVTPKGTRAGHDISIEVSLDAGVPIQELKAKTHEILLERPGLSQAVVRLKEKAVIPNKDFILNYQVAGSQIQDAVLTHKGDKGGFFAMILQPPERVTVEDVTPKELVFVLDTSGSMSGFPIEKAKETMKLALDGLYPRDTFNLITFAGNTRVLFPQPVRATSENLQLAQQFLASRQGGGGTEMMKAIRTALAPSDSQEHVRIGCFMTDGYVGNDMAIADEIQKHPNARVFSFGIGNSVNRFLLDKMAEYGRGEAEYVTLQDDGSAAARRFHERVRNPLLTDISIDWGNLPVTDTYPKRSPDLFSAKPVILIGRYTSAARGELKLLGKMSGRDFERTIPVEFPGSAPDHDVLAKLWARTRIADVMSQDWSGVQSGTTKPEVEAEVTRLGLEYRLMTQFTSFVAVEEMMITDGGQPRLIHVPVEMPQGVSYEGVFGDRIASEGFSLGLKQSFRSLGNSLRAAKDALLSHAPVGQSAPTTVLREAPADQAAAVAPGEEQEASREDGATTVPRDPTYAGLHSKLDRALVSLFARHEQGRLKLTPAEERFAQDGKVEIQIWLGDATPEVAEQLGKLGFVRLAEPKVAKILIGRIAIDKLAALAEIEGVRYVTPFIQ